MGFEDFWYVVAQSRELNHKTVLARQVLDEWLAVFRGAEGQPVALRDRCLHRNSRLSPGRIIAPGQLQCPYHGWAYSETGQVVAVPSEGDFSNRPHVKTHAKACARAYPTQERDGYVYVCLSATPALDPFVMPHYGQPGWQSVRVINRFANQVTNCVENFIDIPHTVSVHPKIFRQAQRRCLEMQVERRGGSTTVEYFHETRNLGWATWFLNPRGNPVYHCDQFHMPNITCVEYKMSPHRHLFITSQSVPETPNSTLVYTDVTFNYGQWSWLARPLVHWTAQTIINQDLDILKIQGETIQKYGEQFSHTPADTIHVFVESIRQAIARGQDPRDLAPQSTRVKFWI
jgi:phenylpropionate dioxygenase-like ring-hydroxylating dioxygenase large terminal subunit